MRTTFIALLAACAGAGGALALRPDRPDDQLPPIATSEPAVDSTSDVLAIAERLAKKDRLIDRVIAGDLRLAEAAEAVITLNRDRPPLAPEFYEVYPGPSLAARVAHMLAAAIERRVAPNDPRRDEVLRRLIHELREVTVAGSSSTIN